VTWQLDAVVTEERGGGAWQYMVSDGAGLCQTQANLGVGDGDL
jgi:hypothetical protein